jgi:phage shock protein A
VDFIERKKNLQTELAQLNAARNQLEQQLEQIRVRMIQLTGKIEFIDELEKQDSPKEESVN